LESKELGSMLIPIGLERMLASIKFHNQTTFQTEEISNEWTNGVLTAKFCPIYLSKSQSHP
jgi:hypothetical protein